MATLSMQGGKGLVLHYDDETSDENDELLQNEEDTFKNETQFRSNRIDRTFSKCKLDPDVYERVKGEDYRGKFRVSNDGRCPRCHSSQALFVILDFLFPMGDMPEFLLHLMSRGQAVLWSSQDDARCKDPPTFTCHGKCPSDIQKSGFNINWSKTDLNKIFIDPRKLSNNNSQESRSEVQISRTLLRDSSDKSVEVEAPIPEEDYEEVDTEEDDVCSDASSVFDESEIDIEYYRKQVAWVVVDDLVIQPSEVETGDEDKLIRNMLAMAEAREDWLNGKLICRDNVDKGDVVDQSLKEVVTEDVKDEKRDDACDEEEDADSEDNDEELQKQQAKEAEEKLLREKVASLFGPQNKLRIVPAIGKGSIMSKVNARIAQQYDDIANTLAGKGKQVFSTPLPTMSGAEKLSTSAEISRKPVSYSQHEAFTPLSASTNIGGAVSSSSDTPTADVADAADGSCIVTTEKEVTGTGEFDTVESVATVDAQPMPDLASCLQTKQEVQTEVAIKSNDFPVSEDGKCPYCKSFDVLYIILQYEDDDPNEELPQELNELLQEGNAYKMIKGDSDPPSFQCVSCTYGFNLDWSKVDLKTVFQNKKTAKQMTSEMHPVSGHAGESNVTFPAPSTQALQAGTQYVFPPGQTMAAVGAEAAYPPAYVAYGPTAFPGQPAAVAYMQPVGPFPQPMTMSPGYPGYSVFAAPMYHRAWFPAYPTPAGGMVPMYPVIPQPFAQPQKKKPKYTISVWHASKDEIKAASSNTESNVAATATHPGDSNVEKRANEEIEKTDVADDDDDDTKLATDEGRQGNIERTVVADEEQIMKSDLNDITKGQHSSDQPLVDANIITYKADLMPPQMDILPPGVEWITAPPPPGEEEGMSSRGEDIIRQGEPLPPGIMPDEIQANTTEFECREDVLSSKKSMDVKDKQEGSFNDSLCWKEVGSATQLNDNDLVLEEHLIYPPGNSGVPLGGNAVEDTEYRMDMSSDNKDTNVQHNSLVQNSESLPYKKVKTDDVDSTSEPPDNSETTSMTQSEPSQKEKQTGRGRGRGRGRGGRGKRGKT